MRGLLVVIFLCDNRHDMLILVTADGWLGISIKANVLGFVTHSENVYRDEYMSEDWCPAGAESCHTGSLWRSGHHGRTARCLACTGMALVGTIGRLSISSSII